MPVPETQPENIKENNTHVHTPYKLKVKLSLYFNSAPCHEGVLGSGGIAPSILDFGTRQM
jgi:hypothetical protein